MTNPLQAEGAIIMPNTPNRPQPAQAQLATAEAQASDTTNGKPAQNGRNCGVSRNGQKQLKQEVQEPSNLKPDPDVGSPLPEGNQKQLLCGTKRLFNTTELEPVLADSNLSCSSPLPQGYLKSPFKIWHHEAV